MHPSIAQRITLLEGLRARTRQATEEFYQKPNAFAPPLAPLFIVKPVGSNCFALIERATGRIVAERFGHNNATGHARVLEAKSKQLTIKQFRRALPNGFLRVALALSLFAFSAAAHDTYTLQKRNHHNKFALPANGVEEEGHGANQTARG
ncbi:hypothetical protein PS685_00411 [Pseudomonas fluorescens]|uniref:Uncharacterized protein n=1 Tax=Pseudomonas fluorescens TaxID=294 RepID=A0A5E6YDE1_PSEFL|nr:hypothetical protein [Pseudomonas fluorescens]VVN50887.1 hypothetical protein PS685_00411 [Pseudomonas fluorescens]